MKQNKKNIKITILLIFINIILNLTLVKSQINISEHEETLKNFNIQNNSTIDLGSYNINNLNGNIIYTYPISNYSYNNTNIPVTLNYCGNVNFTSFAAYDKGNGGNPDKWIKLDNQKPLWVLAVDGFVVQTLSKVSTFFNDLDINKNKTISTLPPTDDKINQYNHPKYYDYKNKDVIWLVEGYDYCNSMVDTRVWGQDVIKILKGDGTILELLNSTSAMSNSSPMTNNQDLRYSGRYYENGINTSGYAIVEFYNPHNINSNYGLPDNIRSKNLICYGEYGNITYLPRKVRYFPGNGKEYVFLETLAPYGEDLYNYCFQNYNNNTNKFDLSVFPNFLIDNNINVFPSPNEYSNLNLGFNSNFGAFNPYSNIKYNNNLISGRPIGMPTIFYLTEIHNEHKLITKLKYNSNSLKSINKENVEIDQLLENEFNTEKEFLDMSIGRGTINSFFNHQIEYSSIFNHFKISTPEKIVIADFIYNENDKLKFSNKNYTLYGKIENIDKNNFIDFDYLPLGNLKQFKPSFINNSSYLLGLKDLYHNSIILYPSIISEFHTKNTDIDDLKKPIVTTNFVYEEYNTNFTFNGEGGQFIFPRYNFSQSIDYVNKSLNLTNKRLTQVISDNVEYTFSYKDAERQNFINNPCLTCKSQLNSIQKFYSYNNVVNSVVENYNQLSILKKFLFEYSTKIDNDSFEIQYFPLKSSITESHSTNGGSTFLTKSKKIKYFNNLSTHIKARGVKHNNNQYSIYHKELIREDELYYKNDLTNNVWDYRNTTLYDYEFLKNSTGSDISNKFYPTKSISYTLKNQGSVSEYFLTNYNQSNYELTNIDFDNRVLKPFLESTYEPQFSYELKRIKEFNFYNNCFGDFQATNNILANLEVNFTNFKNQTKLNTINNSKINNIIETEYENFGYLNDANIQDKKERRLNLTMSFLNFNNIKKINVLKNLMTTYNTNNCDFNFNLKNLSFEEGISQTRYYEYFNLNKLFFRPIFGLVKSKIVKKNDNSILNGIENEYYLDNIVNNTTNEVSLIRGKLQRSYILGLNATPTLNRKLNYENQYNIGYELGGLVKSTFNTNNAKIVNFYDFNSFDYNFFTSKFCDNLYLEKNNLFLFNEYSGTTNSQNFGYYLRNSNSKSSNFIKNIIDSDNLPYKNANNEKTISSKILTNKDNVYYEQINSGVNSYFKNSPNVTLIYKRDNLNNNYTNISNIDYLSYFKEFNIKNEVTSFTNSNGWLNNYKYDIYGRLIRTNNSGDFSNPLSYLTELDNEMNEQIAINESYSYTEDIVDKVSLFTYYNKYDCINGKKIFKEKTGITDLTNNKTYQQFFEDENITLFKFSYPYDCINLIANEEVWETSPLTIYSTLPDNIISINNLSSVALEFNIKRIIDDNNINLEGIKSIKVDVKITNNNSIMMNESYEMSIIKNLINDNNIENNLDTDIDKENLDKLLTSYTAKIDLNEFKNNIKNIFNSQNKLLKVEISIADNEHKGLIIHNNSVLKPRIKLTGGFVYNIDYTIKFRDHFIKNDFTQINNFYRIKENNKYKHYLTQHNKLSSHNQLIETNGFEPIEYFSSFNSFLVNNSLNDKSIRFKESIINPDIQINSLINRYDILNSNYNNVGNSKTYYDGNSNVLNSVLNSRSNGDFDTKIKNEYDSQNRLIRTYKEKGNNIFDKIEYNYLYLKGTDDPDINNDEYFGFAFVTEEVKYLEYLETFPVGTWDKVINRKYTDALGNLRKEILDYSSDGTSKKNITTKYFYDELNRLVKVINPEGHTSRYWYDEFGNVSHKFQVDQGYSSFKYDLMGNLRFSQNQEQAQKEHINFYQYDDLNRVTVFGEAKIDVSTLGVNPIPSISFNVHTGLTYTFNRLTDKLNPFKLNEGTNNPTNDLTFSKTLFMPNINTIENYVNNLANFIPSFTNCDITYSFLNSSISILEQNNQKLGTNYNFKPPYIYSPARSIIDQPLPTAEIDNFEDFSGNNASNILQVFAYDDFPTNTGYVWGSLQFPAKSVWDALAPPTIAEPNQPSTNKLDNLRGNLVATAYREKNNLPFNYVTYSYDARNRVTAIIRKNPNTGYDAIYYTYNSANMVTSARVVDAFRTFVTWYDYDDYGRVRNVYSDIIEDAKLNMNDIKYLVLPKSVLQTNQENKLQLTYNFDPTDINNRLLELTYKTSNNVIDVVKLNYFYDGYNKQLNKITAKRNNITLFEQNISYKQHNRISNNNVKSLYLLNGQETLRNKTHNYYYDNIDQLKSYLIDGNFQSFNFNKVGGRTLTNTTGSSPETTKYFYAANSHDPVPFINQLTTYEQFVNGIRNETKFSYFEDGAMKIRQSKELYQNLYTHKKEYFDYDAKGLLYKYNNKTQYSTDSCYVDDSFVPSTEWRYFYNPSGEREMKRMTNSPDGKTNYYTYPWVKYVLGADNKQLAVYTGAEVEDGLKVRSNDCNSVFQFVPSYPDIRNNTIQKNAYVIMAPSEYNVYGAGMNPLMSWKLGEDGQWFRHFKVLDYLGSTRTEVMAKDRNGATFLQSQYDYEPYGGVSWSWHDWTVDVFDSSRTKYIGKEMDKESNLADHGVRKYENEVGVFTSIDPLWEDYRSLSPYQYAGNNPIMALDWNGMNPENPEVYEIGSWSSLGRPEFDKKAKSKYSGLTKHYEIENVEVFGNKYNNFVEQKSGNNIQNETSSNYIKQNTNDNFLTNTKVMIGATFDFVNTYNEMIEANFENQDKYFHAKANFLATSRGPMGEFMAIHLSNFRELFGQTIKGDPIQDMEQDQVANRFGRKQAKFYNRYDFREALKFYRPEKLPKKY